MNMNIKKMAQNRLNTTKLGRLLKRFMHEEAGIAMEYVVLITLIAAAVAVGVWLFGAQIGEMLGIAGHSAIGEHQKAENILTETVRPNAAAKDQVRVESQNNWTDKEAAKGTLSPE